MVAPWTRRHAQKPRPGDIVLRLQSRGRGDYLWLQVGGPYRVRIRRKTLVPPTWHFRAWRHGGSPNGTTVSSGTKRSLRSALDTACDALQIVASFDRVQEVPPCP